MPCTWLHFVRQTVRPRCFGNVCPDRRTRTHELLPQHLGHLMT
jgi:hypothetical protein